MTDPKCGCNSVNNANIGWVFLAFLSFTAGVVAALVTLDFFPNWRI